MNAANFCFLLASAAVLACDHDDAGASPVAGEAPVVGDCADHGEATGFATCVDDFAPAAPASFGHDALPGIVLGPPMPPAAGGSMDVASLGCGGSITLGIAGGVDDRPGPDLIVFENAFAAGAITFVEPAIVLVSDDGEAWFEFPCDATADAATGCAGVTPTRAGTPEQLRDPEVSGGDAFDLQALGLDHIRWIRLHDRTREHYGDDMWCGGKGGGFDLDAIAEVREP